MIVLHPCSHGSLGASFQGEEACMPVRNVSGDILHVVEHVHVPELYSRLS